LLSQDLKFLKKFLECLKNNSPDKILDYTYPGVDHKINDKESREQEVNRAYKYISKFGLPPKDKWIVTYNLQNNLDRLLISIPIFKGHDTTLQILEVNIIIAFPPPEISNNIHRYEIEVAYDKAFYKIFSKPTTDIIKGQN
jgi:hypothetical protein